MGRLNFAGQEPRVGLVLALVLGLLAGPVWAQGAEEGRFGWSLARILSPSPESKKEGSGHPLMTPEAIQRATSNFEYCLESLWPMAAARRISRPVFERAIAGLEPDLRILELMDLQPEFTKPIWEYLDLAAGDKRVLRGRELLIEHRAAFEAVERTFGVDRHIVLALWGVETNFGAITGDRSVLRSTATLACIGRRQSYFRDEFVATLDILQRGDVAPDQLKGSWAGAFGLTQFMPTTFKQFAVDFDGDGKRDLVSSVPDAIASTANKLKINGWRAGSAWGYEVALPRGFDFLLADRGIRKSLKEWEALGVRRVGDTAYPRPGDQAHLFVPAGARGPAFLMVDNFRVLMKYNPAEAYALAIGHLADRIRGGGSLVQQWPRDETMLSRTEKLELQQRLSASGYDVGEFDGKLSGKTGTALRHFQARAGLIPDGFASGSLLERLRGAH